MKRGTLLIINLINYQPLLKGNGIREFNQLGNTPEVLRRYGAFFQVKMVWALLYWLKEDWLKEECQEQFRQALSQNGFDLVRFRPLDVARFEDRFNAQPLVQHPCG